MNYEVTAQSGLKVRGGPGTEYEEEAERLICGDVIIGADQESPDSAWLPILLEDDTVGYVARQYVTPVATDYQAQEAAKIQELAPVQAKARAPIMQGQLTAKYGYPKENAGYLKIIDLREFAPHLAHVRDFQGNKWSCRVWGHEALEGPLKTAFRLLCERGLAGELKTYDGCFCVRPMKSGSRPSVHSWALALDFNALTNPFQSDGSEDLITDFSDDFVRCFAEAGFEWGGLWTSCHDAMHFQLPWTQDWRQSDNPLRPLVSAPTSQPQLAAPGPEAAPPAGEPLDQSVDQSADFSTKEGTIAAIQAECQK